MASEMEMLLSMLRGGQNQGMSMGPRPAPGGGISNGLGPSGGGGGIMPPPGGFGGGTIGNGGGGFTHSYGSPWSPGGDDGMGGHYGQSVEPGGDAFWGSNVNGGMPSMPGSFGGRGGQNQGMPMQGGQVGNGLDSWGVGGPQSNGRDLGFPAGPGNGMPGMPTRGGNDMQGGGGIMQALMRMMSGNRGQGDMLGGPGQRGGMAYPGGPSNGFSERMGYRQPMMQPPGMGMGQQPRMGFNDPTMRPPMTQPQNPGGSSLASIAKMRLM